MASNVLPDGWNLIASTTIPTSTSTFTVSNSGGSRIAIILDGASATAVTSEIRLRFNGDTAANYYTVSGATGVTYLVMGSMAAAASVYYTSAVVELADKPSSHKPVIVGGAVGNGGTYRSTNPITSITIFCGNGNFDAGSYQIWVQK
jgi:hypothetical protein